MKTLYFDCFAGISGDMTLGAFLDAGVDGEYLIKELDKLGVSGYHIEIEKRQKRGIMGTQCHVIMDHHEHAHRHFSDIRAIIENSTLSEAVKETALAIFRRVAEAEGKVHGLSVDEVHFHEVGAVDSIADIVGAAICFHALAPDAVYASKINVGKGFVKCAHGLLPVPAPAVAEILATTDFPVYALGTDGEAATPTGVAILAELAEYAPNLPEMKVKKIGYGFGEREFEVLNGLRILVGESELNIEAQQDGVWILEANLDDMTGETAGYVLEKLFSAGARDAFYTPIYMKKNRPAMKLTVITDEERRQLLEQIIFSETTTIGLRRIKAERSIMERHIETVSTPLGPVCVKVCRLGEIVKRAPEYEDLRRLAQEKQMPFIEVMKIVEAVLLAE